MRCKAGGRYVSSLIPEQAIILAMNSTLSLSKDSIKEACSMKRDTGTSQKLGGLKHEKSTRYTGGSLKAKGPRPSTKTRKRQDNKRTWKMGSHSWKINKASMDKNTSIRAENGRSSRGVGVEVE